MPLGHGLILGIIGTILTIVVLGVVYGISSAFHKKKKQEEENQKKHKKLFGWQNTKSII